MQALRHTSQGWTPIEDLEAISDIRVTEGNLVWVEVSTLELNQQMTDLLADEFSLHELAVEDATGRSQRPKLEHYEDHLFAVIHQLDEIDGELEPSQIACFIGDRWMLIVHGGTEHTLNRARDRIISPDTRECTTSADMLHAVLDVAVDDYQSITDRLEDEVETLEDVVLAAFNPPVQRQIYAVKQKLARIRRHALPARRVLESLVERNDPILSAGTDMYLRDVSDHLLRMTDQVKQIDDLSQAVLDLLRGEQAQSLNEVTKKLTSWAAIIAVPTFIASVYGMNVHLLPEGNSVGNFYLILGFMLVLGAVLYMVFKRKGWL